MIDSHASANEVPATHKIGIISILITQLKSLKHACYDMFVLYLCRMSQEINVLKIFIRQTKYIR